MPRNLSYLTIPAYNFILFFYTLRLPYQYIGLWFMVANWNQRCKPTHIKKDGQMGKGNTKEREHYVFWCGGARQHTTRQPKRTSSRSMNTKHDGVGKRWNETPEPMQWDRCWWASNRCWFTSKTHVMRREYVRGSKKQNGHCVTNARSIHCIHLSTIALLLTVIDGARHDKMHNILDPMRWMNTARTNNNAQGRAQVFVSASEVSVKMGCPHFWWCCGRIEKKNKKPLQNARLARLQMLVIKQIYCAHLVKQFWFSLRTPFPCIMLDLWPPKPEETGVLKEERNDSASLFDWEKSNFKDVILSCGVSVNRSASRFG